jgi:hypothetical protein
MPDGSSRTGVAALNGRGQDCHAWLLYRYLQMLFIFFQKR